MTTATKTTTDKTDQDVWKQGFITTLLLKLKVPEKYAGGLATIILAAISSLITLLTQSCTTASHTSVTLTPDGQWQLEYHQTAPAVPTGTVIEVDGNAK